MFLYKNCDEYLFYKNFRLDLKSIYYCVNNKNCYVCIELLYLNFNNVYNFMIKKYYNIQHISNVSIIIFIILSFFLHILCIIFLIYSTSFDQTFYNPLPAKDCKIVTLFPAHYVNVEKILKKEYLLKPKKTIQDTKTSKSYQYNTHKILENSNNITNVTDNDQEINKNNIRNNDRVLSEFNATRSVNATTNVVDKEPCIIKYFQPKYPNSAKLLNIEGELKVMYDINVIGKIENIRILASIPNGIFEGNTKLAMRKWICEKNKPKKNLIIVFKFSLNSPKNFSN